MKKHKRPKGSPLDMLGLKSIEKAGLLYNMPMLHINCAGEVVVENSKGIKNYTKSEISLDMGAVLVSIKGDEMVMQTLEKACITIKGRFFSFEILYGGASSAI